MNNRYQTFVFTLIAILFFVLVAHWFLSNTVSHTVTGQVQNVTTHFTPKSTTVTLYVKINGIVYNYSTNNIYAIKPGDYITATIYETTLPLGVSRIIYGYRILE